MLALAPYASIGPTLRCWRSISQAYEAALADECHEVFWIEAPSSGTGVNLPYQRLPSVSGPDGREVPDRHGLRVVRRVQI